MKILNELPPIYDSLIQAGMNPDLRSTVFTYGDILYNPSGRLIPDYLIKHEEVHSKQQGDNPDVWWDRYLQDLYFRIEQETEAYARQYDFICSFEHDRNKRAKILWQLSASLSGPMYGKVIVLFAAMKMIKNTSSQKLVVK